MSRRRRLLVVAATIGATVAITATGSVAAPSELDGRGGNIFREQLAGYAEVPTVSSPGSGTFRAFLNERAGQFTWQLSYANLPTPVTQAHVHFGSATQAGGISFFLCANPPATPPVPTQPCPLAPATISGTITAADVIGPTNQGIGVGEFAEIVAAMRAGLTYVNVHTQAQLAGEIRAQLGHH